MTTLKTAIRRGLLAVFVIAVFASPSYAVATYTYTGNNYAVATTPFDTSMKITGSFSLATPLAPNLSLTDIEAQLLSFNFNDGVATYTSATPDIDVEDFRVGTDVSGNIDEWEIALRIAFPPTQVGDIAHGLFMQNPPGFDSVGVFTCTLDDCPLSSAVAFNFSPGTWTANVPEPGSLFLLLSGFAGFGLLHRVRKKK